MCRPFSPASASAGAARSTRHAPTPDSATAGFTIMEVMMAVMVLAMAIATSITTMTRALQSLDSARNMTLAGQIMQSEIERVRLKDWDTINGYSTTATALDIDSSFSSNNYVANLIAHRGLSLSRTVSDPETDLRQITMTVTWRNIDGRTISRSYTTYYARYGMYDYFYNTSP